MSDQMDKGVEDELSSEISINNVGESLEDFIEDKQKKGKKFEQSEDYKEIFDIRKFENKPLSLLGPLDMDRDQVFKIIILANKNWMENPAITKEELLEKYRQFRNLNKALYGVVFASLIMGPISMMLSSEYLDIALMSLLFNISIAALTGHYFEVKNEYYKWVINKKVDETKMRNLNRLEEEYDANVKRKNIASDDQDEAISSQGFSEF